MGKIRGTLCTQRYIFVQHGTAKIFKKSFCLKDFVVRKGLPKVAVTALGAGGPRFKSGRPDHSFSIYPVAFSRTPNPRLRSRVRGLLRDDVDIYRRGFAQKPVHRGKIQVLAPIAERRAAEHHLRDVLVSHEFRNRIGDTPAF